MKARSESIWDYGVKALYILGAFWLILFSLIPFFMVLVSSFLERGFSDFFIYSFDIKSYLKLFDMVYLKVFLNSFLLSSATSLICLFLGYPFAYWIARMNPGYRSFCFLLVIIPFWTSSLVRTYALIAILRANGILNSILLKIGVIEAPLELLYTDLAVLIGLVYTLLPYMILPLYSAIEKLDFRYIEAARDLGATATQTFFKITLPMTMPGIIGGLMLTFIPAMGLFFIPDMLGGARSQVLGSLIRDQFLVVRNWPMGSALSIVLTLMMAILMLSYVFASKRLNQEVEF